jgi:type IV secretory pathway TrbD component
MRDMRFWIAASVLTVLWIIAFAAAIHAAVTMP